jgi:hypothetical protein
MESGYEVTPNILVLVVLIWRNYEEFWMVYCMLEDCDFNIELHVDSLVVAKAIMSQGNGSWRGRSLVERIRLLALDWEVVISHTYREANKCVDALANYGCSMDNEIIYFDRCPSSISNLLLFDVLSNTTNNVISL